MLVHLSNYYFFLFNLFKYHIKKIICLFLEVNLCSFIYHLKDLLNVNPYCKNFKDLLDIKITLKSRKDYKNNNPETHELTEIILRPEDYIINGKRIKKILDDIYKNNNDDLFKDAIHTNNFDCKSAFMSINVPEPRGPILIFGEYFMKKFYTVFDRDQKVLGFSIANQDNFIKNHSHKKNLIKNIKTPYDPLENEINKDIDEQSNNLSKNYSTKTNKIRFIERETNDKIVMKNKKNVATDDVLFVHP